MITVAATEPVAAEASRSRPSAEQLTSPVRWSRYGWAVALAAACTGLAFLMFPHVDTVNLVMVYLLGVTIAGLRLGRGPSVLTSVLSVASFDYFFVPPRFNFAVSDAQYLLTFGVMLLISLVIATLMASVRQQTRVSGARERRTSLLYAMSRELAATRGTANMCRVAVRHVAECSAVRRSSCCPTRAARPALSGRCAGGDLAAGRGSGGGAVGNGPRAPGRPGHRHAARGGGAVRAARG